MNKDLKQAAFIGGFGIGVVWAVLTFFGIVDGLAVRITGDINKRCDRIVRLEYVIPGQRIGCWLGETVDSK